LAAGAGVGSEAGAGVGSEAGAGPNANAGAEKLEAYIKSEAGVSLSISVTVSSKTSSSIPGRLGGRLLSLIKIGQKVGSILLRPISIYYFQIS
jgi:hypothetical protein